MYMVLNYPKLNSYFLLYISNSIIVKYFTTHIYLNILNNKSIF